MSAQSNGQQQPAPETIIAIQRSEIDRLNDNRVYLMAVIEELQKEAQSEIGRLGQELSLAKSSGAEQIEADFAADSAPERHQ